MFSPSFTSQDNKSPPRGVGHSLSGTPLSPKASLRSARLGGTSLRDILLLADALLHGASLLNSNSNSHSRALRASQNAKRAEAWVGAPCA
jgi:hypothetical protein